MPRPVGHPASYLPGLDGLRALSVVAVVGYHLEVPYMSGGLIGVGMFFTLSGYLITTILLRTWRNTGGIDLREFWLRRARRLLPGVVLLLVVVLGATAIASPDDLGDRLTDSLWAMLYVSNWATIFGGDSYFDRFAGLGPLDHLWSLAIEEQFYVIWPPLFVLLLKLFKAKMSRILAVTMALVIGSFVLMAVLASAGLDNTRVYEGTDTRAGGLLLGAAVALLWKPGRHTAKSQITSRTTMDAVGVGALSVLVWLVATTDEFSLSLYRGGLLTLSLATVALVAVVVHPSSLVGAALGVAPLRWIGERSYGIYLWHLPLVALTPEDFLPDRPVLRGTIVVLLTLLIAELSWTLIEDPIRRHGFLGALRQRRTGSGEHAAPIGPRLSAGVAWSFVAIFGIAVLSASAMIDTGRDVTAGDSGVGELASGATLTTAPLRSIAPVQETSTTSTIGTTSTTVATTTTLPLVPETSCSAVAHVGDSTSIGLMSPSYLPNEAERIDARYVAFGAESVITDISGARSIVEPYKNEPNAEESMVSLIEGGHDGCWVIAMGTNDAANFAAGSNHGAEERIEILMSHIGDNPVLWVAVKSLRTTGPYRNEEMQRWNTALVEACARHPNMRVYDWPSEVADEWFQDDEIHFTSEGYAHRATLIASALARAFPVAGETPGPCLIRNS